MAFRLVAMLIAIAFTLWITYRLTALSKAKWYTKSFILFGLMVVLCVPILVRDRNAFSGTLYDIAYYSTYFAFICLILFACLLFVRDVLWLLCGLTAKVCKKTVLTLPYTRETLVRANIWTFAIAFFLSLCALHDGVKVPAVRTITVTTPKISAPVDMVVLSDLHLYRALRQGKLVGIVEKTNALNPDIILLPGDTIDDHPNRITLLLNTLGKLKAKHGIFVTDGNHEFYIGQAQTTKALTNLGFIHLFNQGVSLPEGVFIAGIPDHATVRRLGTKADLVAALKGSNPDMYRVLLSHQPSIAPQSAKAGFDMQLSGHTHGGQIFPFHLITKLFNGYLRGMYDVLGMKLYVTSGAGQWGPQMRLFAPAEIVHIRLIPEQAIPVSDKKDNTELPVFVPTPLQADPGYFPPVFHKVKTP